MSRPALLVLLLLASCGSPAETDASWLFGGDSESEDVTIFDDQVGVRLDYSHGDALQLITLHTDGRFELAIRNCSPGDFVLATGHWEPSSDREIILRADAPFGLICCKTDTLILEPASTNVAGEDDLVDVWTVHEDDRRERLGLTRWTRGEPCLTGCCSFEGGVCDPVVELCP